MYNDLIGLDVEQARETLLSRGACNVRFVSYKDKKLTKYDKEIVVSVRETSDGVLEITACPMLFSAGPYEQTA